MPVVRLYARYSTERQSEASVADQLRVCRGAAAARAWPIADEYVDEGISGAALGNRPGVQRLLAELVAGEVLMVMDLSRLSRSQDLAPLLARLRHRRVRVMGVQDAFDSESRHARMQAGLSGIMSEEFRTMIADRTRSALELRAREGRSTGGKAYADADVVREIFARFAAGESMRAIASDLNARGVPAPGARWNRRTRRKDGCWLVSGLHALLHNERYVGRLIWNRSQWFKDPDTGTRVRRERPETEWIVRQVPAVVDEDTWQRVQRRFNTRRGRGGAPKYLLSGLLECALCGSKLIVIGGSQHRYVCGTHHGGGEHACRNSSSVPRKLAEERILEPVMQDMLSPEAIRIGMKMMKEAFRDQLRPAAAQDGEVAALERMVREGMISRETAAPAIAEARRKAEERALTSPAETQVLPSPQAWRAAVLGMREILQGQDIPAARACLKKLLGPIRCRPEGDHVIAELTARQVLFATGTGRWIGSGGRI